MTIALQTVDDPSPDDPVMLRYRVAGHLDADSFRAVQQVEQHPAPDTVVEIDLRQCSGMDDFGFGSLVGLIRRAREQHARVRVRGAAGFVRDSLLRSGVERLVDVVPSDRIWNDHASSGRASGEDLATEGVHHR